MVELTVFDRTEMRKAASQLSEFQLRVHMLHSDLPDDSDTCEHGLCNDLNGLLGDLEIITNEALESEAGERFASLVTKFTELLLNAPHEKLYKQL